MPKYITHAEAIEFRQRIAKMQRLQSDAQEEQLKLRRFEASLLSKYGCNGLRCRINWESTEIEFMPDPKQHSAWESWIVMAQQDFWTEDQDGAADSAQPGA